MDAQRALLGGDDLRVVWRDHLDLVSDFGQVLTDRLNKRRSSITAETGVRTGQDNNSYNDLSIPDLKYPHPILVIDQLKARMVC
jgi:hypothetical protein